jgi:hypothetical protein
LKSVRVIDHSQREEISELISTSEKQDLISIEYEGTPKSSKKFVNTYHALKLSFSELTINFSRSNVLKLVLFANGIQIPNMNTQISEQTQQSTNKPVTNQPKATTVIIPKKNRNDFTLKLDAKIGFF